MQNRKIMGVLGICFLALAACTQRKESENAVPAATSSSPEPQHAAPSPSVDPSESVSAAVAELFAGLVDAIHLHPEQNAVDVYAQAFGWRETPAEMNVLLNARRGFAGKLAGQTVLLGSDGSNDIFSIAVRDNFDPQQFQAHLRGAVTLKPGASDTTMGQSMELYRLFDGEKEVGLLSLTYGVAEAIRGSGTVGYVSLARARKEGIGG